jgi:hypothetical protein
MDALRNAALRRARVQGRRAFSLADENQPRVARIRERVDQTPRSPCSG